MMMYGQYFPENENDGDDETMMEETLSSLASLVQRENNRGYSSSSRSSINNNRSSSTSFSNAEKVEVSSQQGTTDNDCRTKMIEWCYQIVEYCKIDRSCVEIAISYFDRFVAKAQNEATTTTTAASSQHQSSLRLIQRQDPATYQLACMTALYMAVKIHDTSGAVLDPPMIVAFSRGTYTSQQIEQMELEICFALDWYVQPPTTDEYLHGFINLIPSSVLSSEIQQVAYQIAIQQTELAVYDPSLSSSTKPSIIAYCSYMNALEYLSMSSPYVDWKDLGYVGYVLAKSIMIGNSNDPYIVHVQRKLYPSSTQHVQAVTPAVVVVPSSSQQQQHVDCCTTNGSSSSSTMSDAVSSSLSTNSSSHHGSNHWDPTTTRTNTTTTVVLVGNSSRPTEQSLSSNNNNNANTTTDVLDVSPRMIADQ